MIVVAGLTPAWQQTLRFETLRVGEVNRAAEAAWCASGKVLNVGIAAHRLGAECRTICPVGGAAREPFVAELTELGVAVDWVAVREPTRICTTLLCDGAATTELVENARPLAVDELAAYRAAFERAAGGASIVVLTGSLPAGTPSSFYRDLEASTGARLVVDARGAELHELLAAPRKPLVVKPNREELAATVGRALADEADLRRAMRELNERGAEWVVVTDGPRAVWVASRAGLWRAVPPQVANVVNPIGCGDCLAAGLAVGLEAGRELLDALRLGMAAAADNLATLLPARIDGSRAAAIAATIEVLRVE